jgi:archaetidylinositol phosphate synthase
MSTSEPLSMSNPAAKRPWDARLARKLVMPLKDTWVSPNHLTTVRLSVGLAGAAAFLPGNYLWSNVGALLMILSNFLDHTDGELARISGKSSRIGHIYDLASDAAVTILLFIAIGAGAAATKAAWQFPPVALGLIAGCAIALIFYLRMRIENLLGKAGSKQASLGGFETEDVLYLLPLITLSNGLVPMLQSAAVCAPLFAIWVVSDYRRALRQRPLQVVG